MNFHYKLPYWSFLVYWEPYASSNINSITVTINLLRLHCRVIILDSYIFFPWVFSSEFTSKLFSVLRCYINSRNLYNSRDLTHHRDQYLSLLSKHPVKNTSLYIFRVSNCCISFFLSLNSKPTNTFTIIVPVFLPTNFTFNRNRNYY